MFQGQLLQRLLRILQPAKEEHKVSTKTTPQEGGIIRGGGKFIEGTKTTIRAQPAEGFKFEKWTGDVTGTKRIKTITVDSDKQITAHFTPITPPEPPKKFDLTAEISPREGGRVEGTGTYEAGETISISAIPEEDYKFSHWEGDLSGKDPTESVTMTKNKSIIAHFEEIPEPEPPEPEHFSVSITVKPFGGGSVSGAGTYLEGETVTVVAHPKTGYEFSHWGGDLGGTDPSQDLVMREDKHITAFFEPENFTVTIDEDPPEGGEVQGYGTYEWEEKATIKAIPNAGWEFEKWTGDLAGTEKEKEVFVTEDIDAIAHFTTKDLEVSITSEPSEGGSATGEGRFSPRETVTIEAEPAEGYEFLKWEGDVSGTDRVKDIIVNKDLNIIAQFTEKTIPTYSLTTSVLPANSGKVEGGGTFEEDEEVTLTAKPAEGYVFDHWEGDVSGADKIKTVVMTRDKEAVAKFVEELEEYRLRTYTDPSRAGRVEGAGTYGEGDEATVRAVPEEGWQFDHWEGDLSGTSAEKPLTMDEGKEITAVFEREQVTFTGNLDPSEGGSIENAGTYNYGRSVWIRAKPAEGWEFDYWSGDLSGTERIKNVRLTEDVEATAHFVKKEHQVSIKVEPIEAGEINIE